MIRLWNKLSDFVAPAFPPHRRLRIGMARRNRDPRFLFGDQLAVEKEVLRCSFQDKMGFLPDLDHPRRFTEKIQWRKLFDRRRVFSLLVDKFRVRSWVEERVGSAYLIPLLYAADSVASLPFDSLPTPYIVKPSHSSGLKFPVHSTDQVDTPALNRMIGESMKVPYGILEIEWAYWHVKPMVIVEKLLVDGGRRIPSDFKIHCFGGEAHFVQVHTDRFTHFGQVTYTREWEKLEMEQRGIGEGRTVSAPASLQEMLDIAEALASGFDYVRVDLYDVDGRIYFGEMTIYPGSGFRRFTPDSWDLEWGQLWDLPQVTRDSRPGSPSRS